VRWRSGALLKHPDGVHAALVTVDRHAKTAELRVRGSYPHDFFAVLKDGFEQTLQRYPGLDVTRFVPCPHRNPDGSACRHEFRHEQLRARVARNPPLESIECPEHLEDMKVSDLLQGIERPAAARSEQMTRQVMEKLDRLEIIGQRRHEEVRGGIEQARAELSAMVAEQQRGFLELRRREQSQQEAICPSVVWYAASHVVRRGTGCGPVRSSHCTCAAKRPASSTCWTASSRTRCPPTRSSRTSCCRMCIRRSRCSSTSCPSSARLSVRRPRT
jgi:hypothetical protein